MREIKVGLIGFGTVGSGVVKVLQKNSSLIESEWVPGSSEKGRGYQYHLGSGSQIETRGAHKKDRGPDQ